MGWHARLALDYRMENERCVTRAAHEGPLRILQTLYPEGDGVAHNVLVHPPGGLVGGDTLEISVHAGAGSHALVTTPGAARFYRSAGEPAVQDARIALDSGSRCEWLPLEAICYSGCIAENRLTLDLAPDSELIGWDVTAFGLPASKLPFQKGSLLQHLELKGGWLERGRVDALDHRLMDGPLGLAGHRCLATLFLASGNAITRERRGRALEVANDLIAAQATPVAAGATAPGARVIVVRALAPQVEPALALLKSIRAGWRKGLWALPPTVPRIWTV
jgi:urease accessory protein